METIIEQIRADLKSVANEECRTAAQRFFKEPINSYGITSADLNRIIRTHARRVKALPKDDAFTLCEALWRSSIQEECILACSFAYGFSDAYSSNDFALFERWISNYVTNWATCDTFCNHTMGDFLVKYPNYVCVLKKWTQSPNRWVRRAAAVSLIIPAKRGEFLADVFEIADLLLIDTDDMVQKGYGWLLKVAAEKHTSEVYDYVIANRARMPRTALRYAIEKMPKELKKEAMQKQNKALNRSV